MKRTAVAAVILIALLCIAVVIAVGYVDLRPLALEVAASVRQATGRELTFGEVGVKWFPQPVILLSDVRLGNAQWGSQPWMVRANQIRADIGALPLLSGRLHVSRIAVSEASLLLETDPAGNGNWVLRAAGGGPPSWLGRLEIDALELKPLAVTWRDGAGGRTAHFQLDAATFDAPTAAPRARFSIQGSVAGMQADLSGSIGGLAALMADGAGYPVDVEAKLGSARLTLRGTVDQPLELGSLHVDLGAQGAEISDVAALLGDKLPPLGQFHGSARASGTPAALVLSDIAIDVGAPERLAFNARGGLEASALLSRAMAWSSAELDLSVQGAQISDFAAILGKSVPALGRYRIAARLRGSSAAPSLSNIDLAVGSAERVELTARGAVGNLRTASGADLQLTAGAARWWYPGDGPGGPRLPPFRLRTRLRGAPNGYAADGLELKIADTTVKAALAVHTGGTRPRITAKVWAPSIDLARLAAPTGEVASSPLWLGEHWQLADVDLDLQVGKLILADGRRVQAATGRVSLADGRLSVAALKATLGGARVECDGVIAEPARMSGLDVNLSVQGNELADLLKFTGHSIPSVGPYRGSARALGSFQALQLTAIDATAGKSGQRLRATGRIADTLHWEGLDLNLKANIGDSVAFGRVFGADVPRLAPVAASARMTGPAGGYVFEGLNLALARTTVKGRLAIVFVDSRPHVTATLSGPLVDLAELTAPSQLSRTSLLPSTDLTAKVRFDRVILADKRMLSPVSGDVEIVGGAAVLRHLTVGVEGVTATLDGGVAEPLRLSGLDLLVSAQMERVAALNAFTGMHMPELPPLTASGRLTDTPNGYAVSNLKLVSSVTEINGDLALVRGGSRFRLTAKLASPLLDAEGLKQTWPTGATVTPATTDGRVFSKAPLPLGLLKAIDLDLDLRIDKLRVSDAEPLGPLAMRAVLSDGRLRADPVQIGIDGNESFAMTGSVDASGPRAARWSFTLTGRSVSVGEVLKRIGAPGLITGGVSDFALEGTGRGSSVRAILGGLTGNAWLKAGPAVVQHLTVNLGAKRLLGLLGIVDPSRNTDADTQVKCVGINLPIKNGVVTSDRAAAVETARFNVVVSGTIELRSEALDLGVAPVLVQGFSLGTGSLTQLIRVQGTLANPQLDTNVAGAATRGALSLGAAYMTLGGSFLLERLVNRAGSDPSPCATALRE